MLASSAKPSDCSILATYRFIYTSELR